MRKKLVIAVLFLSLILLFLMPTVSADNESIEVDSVNRTLHIDYHRVITVTDEYIFKNTGTDPVTSLIIEIPYEYRTNLEVKN